tara:strand:+ start:19765 stop:20268 length:504 start_codon:yes stop_codon:yes gene_type:complete
MKTTVKVSGVIKFDPKNMTKKHDKQGSWKCIAMVVFNDDMIDYYNWFLKKRYNLKLNRPLRGPHITFINDRKSESNGKWLEIKEKYHNTKIDVILDLQPKTDSSKPGSTLHWWFTIPQEHRLELHGIRTELGLDRPHWGLHMSLGYANEKWAPHSIYLHDLIVKGFI